MGTSLAQVEDNLNGLVPQLTEAVAGMLPVPRLIRSLLISMERNDALLRCNLPSLLRTAMSAAVLGLEMDGVTGQAFPIPFGGVAQLVIGYKGFNTIGARSGLTISGDVVREGDSEWDFRKGSGGFVHHKPDLRDPFSRRIIAAYAVAEHKDRPAAVEVIGIDELLEIKARSPSVKAKRSSPYDDRKIGEPAMFAKSAKRRLSRILPMVAAQPQFHLAAALDEAVEERGKHAYLGPDGALTVEDDDVAPSLGHYEASPTPEAGELAPVAPSPSAFLSYIRTMLDDPANTAATLRDWWNDGTQKAQRAAIKSASDEGAKAVAEARDLVVARIEALAS